MDMGNSIQHLMSVLEKATGVSPEIQRNILGSLIIVFIIYFLRLLFLHLLWRKSSNAELKYRWQKFSSYIAFLLGSLMVMRIWFTGITAVIATLGFISAGIALAFQDLLRGIAGWVYVMWRHPFDVGDRVQVGSYRGDVIDIRLFKFTLLEVGNWVDADQSTGRIVHLPNSLILTESIFNYTAGFSFIWHEIPVVITFESNWKKAKKILSTIAEKEVSELSQTAEKQIKKASRSFMIHYKNLTPRVYTTVADIGVKLTVRYIVEPRRRRSSEEQIWENVLEKFARSTDIDFAYPTIRYYDNRTEGKNNSPG